MSAAEHRGGSAVSAECVRGACSKRRVNAHPQLPYRLHVPPVPHPQGRILVSVHGVSRNAGEHLELLRPYAERSGAFLVAPQFAADAYPDYQRLGRKGRGPRADLALIRLLNDLGRTLSLDTGVVDIFGFSGGAQFAHRFAMAHPQRVRHLVLGAAGWYTMPDRGLSYPYGVADARGLNAVRLDALAAARLATLLLVGEHDNSPDDEELNRSGIVCRTQGAGRLQRAQAWKRAMDAYARRRGETSAVDLRVLPGVGHSFREAVLAGGMGALVFRHCYAADHSQGWLRGGSGPLGAINTGQGHWPDHGGVQIQS